MSLHVAVVGAGIVGASCAYYLSVLGARVTVLERAPAPASGSTAKSAAGLRHQFSHPENVKMSLFSASVFERFEKLTGYNAGYRKVGYLFLTPHNLSEAWAEQRKMQTALGARVQGLSLAETARRFPYLNLDGLAGSSFGPDDGVVDPHAVTLGFLAAARSNGAKVRLETEVLSLVREAGAWKFETSQGTFRVDAVLNAAGAFLRRTWETRRA